MDICVVLGSVGAAALGGLVLAASKLGLLYQLFHKTESKSPRHGGESVAEVLRAHGVKFVFTLVGGHISSILVACEKLGIHIVVTRHETTAVFAADAMARLSGTVGVAAVTAGPGLTNTVTAVKNAQMAESHIAMEPCFRRRADGSLNLTDSVEATKVKEADKGKPYTRPLSPEAVLDKAKKSSSHHHRDLTIRKHLLGFFEIQFGIFHGQTFSPSGPIIRRNRSSNI
ncbi:2-hydroxyacyl-CoA lyase 2-like isoform X2 [Triplophysa rosa]|uniref:2-hydroxyacyl-CoA lyase 2-like isoform X2 n=1 Tax=Triplophysa rosa TaxID=992332 RepID=UPI0025460FEF|nr:2-hydroxyacyl-CoA lyase 2-like isoform X2 [Triplophysa rosa]